MNKLVKLGYFLMGAGIGMLVATFLYGRELEKPVGEVEEYIPPEDEESGVGKSKESDGENVVLTDDIYPEEDLLRSDSSILDYYSYMDERKKNADSKSDDVEFREPNRNQKTRYSKMYDVRDQLEAQRAANEDFNERTRLKGEEKRKSALEQDIYTDFSEYDEELEDGPQDDEVDIIAEDNLLVRERVENNFEIYLGDNPEDYVSLYFYEGDNTLTDDRDRIVPAADEVVGLAALSRLITGGPGADDGTIFVRNLKTMINYEVTLYQGSYSETVLGIIEGRPNEGAGGDVNRRE